MQAIRATRALTVATICGTIVSLLALGTWSAGVATAQPIAKRQPQVAMGFISDPRDSVGGVFVSDISTEYCQGGYLSVGRGTDDRVWYSALSNQNVWSAWAPLVGTVGSSPVLYSTEDHASPCWLLAAARDRRLKVALIRANAQTRTVRADNWFVAPAALRDSPVVSVEAGELFVRGLDNAVWHTPIASTVYNPYGGWNHWSSLGGGTLYAPGVSVSNGKPCVSVIGTDRQMWETCVTTGRWTPLGGAFTGAPAAAATTVNGTATTTTRVSRGLDGAVWCRSDSRGWTSIGGRITPDPLTLMSRDDTSEDLQVGALVGGHDWVRSIDANCGALPSPYPNWTRWLQ